MEKKKKANWFLRILFCFAIMYVAILIAFESGYYENKMSNKATLTKEAMEQFEADVANGEVVDIKEYLNHEKEDYSNSVTKIGNKLSNGLSDVMTKGISGVFNVLKGLFW